jgi:hypothetical protein
MFETWSRVHKLPKLVTVPVTPGFRDPQGFEAPGDGGRAVAVRGLGEIVEK